MTGPPPRLGALCQRLVLAAALLILVAAALGSVLGGIGAWRPLVVLPMLLLAGLGVGWSVRRLPVASIAAAPTAVLLLVVLAFGIWVQSTHSEQVLPRRDSGSNLQAAIALADTGRRILPVPADSIGGPWVLDIDGITVASPAFFEVGSAVEPAIQPQFVVGPAAVYSLGRWAGGTEVMFVQPGWVMALGMLAVGLLLAVAVGPWWAPIGALALALAFPVVHTARATYSEPLAMATLGAGLLAWQLAARAERDGDGAVARMAVVAGLLIGGTTFMRIDGLREGVLVLPVAALAAAQGNRWVRPLLIAMTAGTVGGLFTALLLSHRYVGSIAGSLLPLVGLGLALGTAGAALVMLARKGFRLPAGVSHLLPRVAAAGVVVTGLALASRPLWQTARQSPQDPGARVVAGLQRRQGLPVDGGRTYAEHTVDWLAWWLGPPALVIGLAAAAVLAARCATQWREGRPLPDWCGPLVLASASSVLTLLRPGITPDHPWAERRLLIAVPLVVALVVAGAAALWRRPSRWQRLLAVPVVGVLLLPAAAATWPHRAERVERGSLGPVAAVCRSLAPGDVVLAVDARAANEWPQVVRGMCERPALSTTSSLRSNPLALADAVSEISDAVRARGGQIVLLAADSPAAILDLGATPEVIADATVLEDDRLLTERPEALVPLVIRVWRGVPN